MTRLARFTANGIPIDCWHEDDHLILAWKDSNNWVNDQSWFGRIIDPYYGASYIIRINPDYLARLSHARLEKAEQLIVLLGPSHVKAQTRSHKKLTV